ncbi:ABC transporter substrate-binding protein [Prochlorococcus sp. MIT 1223]|uniref:ABC transporter substrate-binding protein n=1 Tax=Prochlorococcus sp. MIT 1223 TaxID=3096217 RepID=UPI002A750614|nr:ABC transporter substrate-binding protein [Prochlorococcus sp. MIT 1223]
MNDFQFGRRDFVRLAFGSSLLSLIGCSKRSNSPILRAVGATLPKELIRSLPYPWTFEKIQNIDNINPYELSLNERIDLLVVQDGWIKRLPSSNLLPIASEAFSKNLSNKAKDYLKKLGPDYQNKLLPIGVTPWVMIFRNGEQLIDKARKSWSVLLDPKLKGQIIFPKSPRLLLSITDKIGDPEQLTIIKSQIKIYDDMNAMNWLLSGKAKVAILPLQRCIASLIRDSRLSAILPETGAPLNWSLLARPFSSQTLPPLPWLTNSTKTPLSTRLLAKGWIPPIPYIELVEQKDFIRSDFQSAILPSYEVWEKCWPILPLTQEEEKSLERRWRNSIP